MPLPTIVTPTYELELPSTGKPIKYRPFLVKEEKLLVLALETEDTKEISNAIKTVLKNCIQTKSIKVETLPTFDIEYLFLNIRGKSVGEQIEVNLIAPDDGETSVSVSIDIDDIKVQRSEEHTNKIKLDDNLMMEMKYPSLEQFIKTNFDFKNEHFFAVSLFLTPEAETLNNNIAVFTNCRSVSLCSCGGGFSGHVGVFVLDAGFNGLARNKVNTWSQTHAGAGE